MNFSTSAAKHAAQPAAAGRAAWGALTNTSAAASLDSGGGGYSASRALYAGAGWQRAVGRRVHARRVGAAEAAAGKVPGGLR